MNEELLRDGLAQTTPHPLGLRVEHARAPADAGKREGNHRFHLWDRRQFWSRHPDILSAIHEQVDKHLRNGI